MATGRIPINGTAAIQSTIVDAKGDLIAATADNTVARLAVGANDSILVADSGEATGLKWAAPAGGGASFTLLNAGGTALTGSSVTVSGISGINTLFVLVAGGRFSTLGQSMRIRFDGSTTIADYEMATNIAQPDTTYSPNLLYGQDNPGAAFVDLATADAAADLFYASVTMFGANTTNPKPFIYNGATTFRMTTGHAGQGIFQKAAAISSITILGSGTFNAGTVFVYGSAV